MVGLSSVRKMSEKLLDSPFQDMITEPPSLFCIVSEFCPWSNLNFEVIGRRVWFGSASHRKLFLENNINVPS
jgi:hypothetical protein